jgi:hypothetical protein
VRRGAAVLGLVALGALLVWGGEGTLYGALLAAGEVRRAPAAVAAIALLVLLRGARGLPAAAGWAVLGTAAAVAGRVVLGIAGAHGWMPGEATSSGEAMIEAAWLVTVAVLAWGGVPARLAGPLIAAVVATTRIGAYGQAFVPVLWEDTAAEAAALGAAVGAGFAVGVMVVAMGGWMAAVVARIPARWVAPGRVLAGMAVVVAAVRA